MDNQINMPYTYLYAGRRLSESLNLSSKDVKSWLERETGSIFIPVHTKAQKLLDEMSKALKELDEASKMLFDNSGKEIEKRNMKVYGRARAINKLARLFLDRIKQIKIPDVPSYADFVTFAAETQKALAVIEIDVRNWFPRISPYFIMDRRKFLMFFEKAKDAHKSLHNFMTREYVKTKALEETYQLVDKLQALEGQLADYQERKVRVEGEKAPIEKEIDTTQQKIANLKNQGSMSQLHQTNMEIDTLRAETKKRLRHLQKPFIKLLSLATHGEGSGLTPEELGKLNQYLEKPFEALATEEPNQPLLRAILQKLDRSMSEKLKLKPEKERKAKQDISDILDKNSLEALHRKCAVALTRKKQLSASAAVAEARQDLARLQEHVEDLLRRKGVVELEEASSDRARKETVDKIRDHKDEIEKNVFSFMNKKVCIE